LPSWGSRELYQLLTRRRPHPRQQLSSSDWSTSPAPDRSAPGSGGRRGPYSSLGEPTLGLDVGRYNIAGGASCSCESLYIQSGYEVTLYAGPDFQGDKKFYDTSQDRITEFTFSSVTVLPKVTEVSCPF